MTSKKSDFSNVRTGSSTVQGGGGSADFSNVRTGSSTVQGGGSTGGHTTYTVESGDTLSYIAKQFYGKASEWDAIYEANRDQLDDPDKIFPGQILKIPAQGGSATH
ncbi:MAG: LysM peptidoglycan-binding domain-containing protein [Lysobacter sp.]